MNNAVELIVPGAVIGAVFLLMVPFVGAALAVVVVGLVVLAIPVALVGAIVATPVLLVRAVHRHRQSGLTSAGRQAAAPHAPAALARQA